MSQESRQNNVVGAPRLLELVKLMELVETLKPCQDEHTDRGMEIYLCSTAFHLSNLTILAVMSPEHRPI